MSARHQSNLVSGTGVTDPLYGEAVAIVRDFGRGSISMVQRRLRIGYNRSADMLEAMEKLGVITPWGPGGSGRTYVPEDQRQRTDFERKRPDDTEGGAHD